jgi:hypothetical protein
VRTMDVKASGELSDILEVLRRMSMFEAKLAELYSTCASMWREDCQFWLDIWKDEISHALYIGNIIEIIARKPEIFEKGLPFNVSEVQTIVSSVMSIIEEIKKGEITKERLLLIASSLENGFIEDKYSEVVKTDDMEYKILMQKVVDDTRKHKDKITQKIKETTQLKGTIES